MASRGGSFCPRKEVSHKRQRPGEDQQWRRIRPSNFKAQRARNVDVEVQNLGGGLQPTDLGILGERPAPSRSRDPWRNGGEPYSSAQLREMVSIPGWPGTASFTEAGMLDRGNALLSVEQEQILPHAWPKSEWNDRESPSRWPALHAKAKGLLGRAPESGSTRAERTRTGYSGGKDGRVRDREYYNRRLGSQSSDYGILGGAPAPPLIENGMPIGGATRFWEQGLLGKGPTSEALPSFSDSLQGRYLDQDSWEWRQDHESSPRLSDVMLRSHNGRAYADPEHIVGEVGFQDPHRERGTGGRHMRFMGMPEMTFRAQSNGRSLRETALHRGVLGRVPSVTDLDTT